MRSLAGHHLAEQIQRLCTVVDDHLFKLAGQAGSSQMESDYFLVMRLIRKEANAIRECYTAAALRRFDLFFKQQVGVAGSKSAGTAAAELSLVAEEVFEEELAIATMAETGRNLFQKDLLALDQRLAFLSSQDEIVADDNPLGPFSLCQAFAEALKPLPLDVTIKLLVYKLYDQIVVRSLGGFYGELDICLTRAGILPNLSMPVNRGRFGAAGMARPLSAGAGGDVAGSALAEQSYIAAFENLQGLMDNWRSRMGLPPMYAMGFNAPPVATDEVVDTLNALQHPLALNSLLAIDSLKVYVQQQLASRQPDGEARPLARREEDVIDMVSMVFDFILDDVNLPEAVKSLIARLQIPVIKVAILDRNFFGQKNHPARLLLNAMAQAGIGLDMAENGRENPIFKQIEGIVGRILDEFNQNVGLFSDLLDEFTAATEKEAQRSRIAEERTLQATHSKERVRLCKRKVAYEITQRMQARQVPAPARSFLFNTWKDVMVLAYLRRDRSPADWEQSLAVVDGLIWSVTVPAEAATQKKVVEAMRSLSAAIKAGLEGLSMDPQSISAALRDLELCWNIGGTASAGRAGQTTGLESRKVEIRDPELARAIVEIRASLPDVDNLNLADLVGCTENTDAEPIPDEFMSKAHALNLGQWIEFTENGKSVRGKLSWKSQTTNTHVFVNRKGAKVLEISLADLAGRLAQGKLRIIETSSVPLMDRALQTLLHTLKGPEVMPSTTLS